MRAKKLLITGGCGFIGSNFIHHVLHKYSGIEHTSCCPEHNKYSDSDIELDIEIMNVDCLTYAGNQDNLFGIDDVKNYHFSKTNITNMDEMKIVFSEFQPDIIVHFAAESHVDRSIESGAEFVNSNVLGTQVLLDLSREFEIELFVHVSTDEVYGSMEKQDAIESDRLSPSSPYSASKASSDLLALAHHRTYGTPVIVTRCSNNFGPRQHVEKLIPKMISLARSNQKLPIYGSGKQIRNWIHVKDHCEAISMLIFEGQVGEIYNIGSETEISNISLVEYILHSLEKPIELISYVEDRLGHDFRYGLDASKMRKFGWSPKITLEEGLLLLLNS
ncbi:MAG: dTDP-glucose 4,6-dehydratase [Euryarchaeota archaeon]|nr:dTDP-glucose 4,6-dehydratase [Euryarchaeota archaeon]